ncbi:hypothetical protein QF032_000475 [Streptomyces achromogenes]|nr:hypothetical protein [Streptomyces achromogenes]
MPPPATAVLTSAACGFEEAVDLLPEALTARGQRVEAGAYWTSSQSCEPSVAEFCRVSCPPAAAPVRYRLGFLTDCSR